MRRGEGKVFRSKIPNPKNIQRWTKGQPEKTSSSDNYDKQRWTKYVKSRRKTTT